MMLRTIAALSRMNCHQHQPRAILCSWSSTSAAAASNNVFALNQQIKCQPREHPSPYVACAAAAFAALIATSPSSDPRNDPAITKAEAHLDPNMRALGKSLQASHERQMVRMAKLLHSLESLAEEAEEKSKRDIMVSVGESGGAGEVSTFVSSLSRGQIDEQLVPTQANEGDNIIHISETDLSNLSLSPEIVWAHIDALKQGCIYGSEDVKHIARAASTLLRSEPSLNDISHRCKDGELKMVTVVGDLHGHFEDSLLKVLDMVSNKRGYGSPWDGSGAVIFNGDFVDRGKNSLEVLLALLLLKLAYPNHVYLNRGNHEDSVIATVYGCSDELKARYGEEKALWAELQDVFASLPLAVRTDSAVIMHGGLPMVDFTLKQISDITPEERFAIKTMVEPGPNDAVCKLVQNIMWSDPHPDDGVSCNEDRGCGVRYGPDVVWKFLAAHNLKYLIRSHEPVDEGYELLECDEHGMSAVTVFSAASYPAGAGFNYGAIVRLDCKNGGDASFDSYDSSNGNEHEMAKNDKMNHTYKAFADVVASNRLALYAEFEYFANERARRHELKRRFTLATSPAVTTSDPVLITPGQWADAMKFVLGSELPNVNWLQIQRFVAPAINDLIDYKRFLNLHCSLSGYDQTNANTMDDSTRDTILRNYEAIFKVFKFLDVNGDGEVDRDEFCRGINELKKRNPDSILSFDAETLFDSIDEDKNGTIELAEFQKAFQACEVPYHVAVMMSLDEDKSGTIDRHEFKEGVKLLNARLSDVDKIPDTDEEINKIFDELDDNGDEELDLVEFEKFVRDYYPH